MAPAGSSPPRGDDALLQRLLAAQGSTDQKFTEIFRRMDKAETTAAEARDTSKEIVTILREENALARITEVRTEAHQLVQDLRIDVVKAHENLRLPIDAAIARIEALETGRSIGAGTAKAGRWLFEVLKLIAAAGGGALILRVVGGH